MIKKLVADNKARRVCYLAVLFALAGTVFIVRWLYDSDAPMAKRVSAAQSMFEQGQAEDGDGEISMDPLGRKPLEEKDVVIQLKEDLGTEKVSQTLYRMPEEDLDKIKKNSSGFVYLPSIPLSRELQEFTYDRCQELDLEYEMVLAIMYRESGFQVRALHLNTNGTYDNGIMQINDVNRSWLREQHGITDLMDPYQNITAGTLVLSDYFSKYEENQALMAYQYGEYGMKKKVQQGMTTNSTVKFAQDMRDYYKVQVEETKLDSYTGQQAQ